jgi:hypothetical protein
MDRIAGSLAKLPQRRGDSFGVRVAASARTRQFLKGLLQRANR